MKIKKIFILLIVCFVAICPIVFTGCDGVDLDSGYIMTLTGGKITDGVLIVDEGDSVEVAFKDIVAGLSGIKGKFSTDNAETSSGYKFTLERKLENTTYQQWSVRGFNSELTQLEVRQSINREGISDIKTCTVQLTLSKDTRLGSSNYEPNRTYSTTLKYQVKAKNN